MGKTIPVQTDTDLKTPIFLWTPCKRSLLAGPVLWSEALPGTDDLFGSHSSPRGCPVLLVLVLRLYGVDTALWRDIHFNLEETTTSQRGLCETHIHNMLKYSAVQVIYCFTGHWKQAENTTLR